MGNPFWFSNFMTSIASPHIDTTQSRKISKTAAYYYAFIILGLVTGVFGPTINDLARHTQSNLSEISIIFAVRSFGYLVGSLLSGRLFDRVRGHPLIVGALIVTALAFVLIPLIPLLWLLTLVVFLLGLAESSIDVGCNSLLPWVHGDKVGPFMNGLHFFFGVGAFLSPMVVAQVVLSTGEIVWAYWFLAVAALPSALWLTRLPSPSPQKHSQENVVVRVNKLLVAATVAFFFLYVSAEITYGNWIFTYATRLNLGDSTMAALLTSAFWGAFTVGRLIGVPLSTRFKPTTILMIDLLGATASVIGVMLFSQSIVALWLGTIATGAFMASIFPTMLTLAARKMNITGEITGWFLVGGGAGAMFTPWLIGQLIEPVGAQITMVIVLASLVVTLGALGVIVNTGRSRVKR
ncbi:MAG: MFS transporter [Chloroflexi bacterium]|nr:MFS transporter [Chloroflexota bacterium]